MLTIRSGALAILVGLSFALFGCEEGVQGPEGSPGTTGRPRAIRLLLAGADSPQNMQAMILIAYRDRMFPLGSRIDYVDLRTSVPSVAKLSTYDVVYCWSLNPFGFPVQTGDRLADYVDAGGKLVITQFAYAIPAVPAAAKGPLRGRVMTPGYCPLTAGQVSSATNNRFEKEIAVRSLNFPLHPVFNLANDDTITYFSQSDFSDPGLDPTATLLARDTTGDNAVAINARGTIIGLDMLGTWAFQDVVVTGPPYPESNRLIANCILYVAGAY